MNRILKLLIDDYGDRNSTAEYKVEQMKFCEAERAFVNSLSEEQKKAYPALNSLHGELGCIEQKQVAEFVFKNLKEFFEA